MYHPREERIPSWAMAMPPPEREERIPTWAMEQPADGERDSPWFMGIYHEKQVGRLCAKHCVNNMLQTPAFNEIQLGEIARELDEIERQTMGGRQLEQESQNVSADGFFSVQVILRALADSGLTCTPARSAEASGVLDNPASERGFICNRNQHWFAVRKLWHPRRAQRR